MRGFTYFMYIKLNAQEIKRRTEKSGEYAYLFFMYYINISRKLLEKYFVFVQLVKALIYKNIVKIATQIHSEFWLIVSHRINACTLVFRFQTENTTCHKNMSVCVYSESRKNKKIKSKYETGSSGCCYSVNRLDTCLIFFPNVF